MLEVLNEQFFHMALQRLAVSLFELSLGVVGTVGLNGQKVGVQLISIFEADQRNPVSEGLPLVEVGKAVDSLMEFHFHLEVLPELLS